MRVRGGTQSTRFKTRSVATVVEWQEQESSTWAGASGPILLLAGILRRIAGRSVSFKDQELFGTHSRRKITVNLKIIE